MKALKNFSCNGLRKKAGESISEDELRKFGDLKKQLLKDDFMGKAGKAAPVVPEEEPQDVPEEEPVIEGDILDDMDKEALMKYAKELGLNPHHNSGEEKLRDMIRESLEA